MNKKITLIEREALKLIRNAADAQVYIPLSKDLRSIVDNMTQVVEMANQTNITDLKENFIESFFHYHFGKGKPSKINSYLCYSASNGIEIIANLIRSTESLRTGGIALIHPLFDAAYYTFKRHNLNIKRLDESIIKNEYLLRKFLINNKLKVLYLTLPNNPTGFDLSESSFKQTCRMCRELGVLVVIDVCFRFYSKEKFNQYQILMKSKVDWILIEDTGKMFNLLDIKIGFITSKTPYDKELELIHADFILEVSKFSLSLYIMIFSVITEEYKKYLRETVEFNRNIIRENMSDNCDFLTDSNINIELISFRGLSTGKELEEKLSKNEIGIVSAAGYYWDDRDSAKQYFRIALSRDPLTFKKSIAMISEILKQG